MIRRTAADTLRRSHWVGLGVLCVLVAFQETARVSDQSSTPTSVVATAENAAVFLGNWTLTAEGQQGPATFSLAVRPEAGKVLAEISSTVMPKQAITDITMLGPALVLRYSFDYQGMAIPVALTLTPSEGKTAVNMAFADGQYVMTGSAAKAETKP
jgi:hypothetical protein